jgi:hypothetical protein
MRKAATKTGLIPDTPEGHSRLFFVSEGEASLHFCIQKGLTNEAIKVSWDSDLRRMIVITVLLSRVAKALSSSMLVVERLMSVLISRKNAVKTLKK